MIFQNIKHKAVYSFHLEGNVFSEEDNTFCILVIESIMSYESCCSPASKFRFKISLDRILQFDLSAW